VEKDTLDLKQGFEAVAWTVHWSTAPPWLRGFFRCKYPERFGNLSAVDRVESDAKGRGGYEEGRFNYIH